MNRDLIKQQLNEILSNITAIKASTGGQNYEDFRKNEQVKESVYEYLQEIGQVAFDLSNRVDDDTKVDFSLDQLSTLRTARYNQEAEIQHQSIWNLIQNDLFEIGEKIEGSAIYARG